MYKVFINEKKISLTNEPLEGVKSLLFDNATTIEIALDLMENTSTPEVCLYHPDVEVVWNGFTDFFKNVGAAGGIVSNEYGKVLFIKRLGRWDLPKGKIENLSSTVSCGRGASSSMMGCSAGSAAGRPGPHMSLSRARSPAGCWWGWAV